MRVLFHCWEFPPQGGGVGAYMQNMACALAQTGHSAVVVTGRAEGKPTEDEQPFGVVYRVYDQNEIGSAKTKDRLLAIARNHTVEIIEGADHLGECADLLMEKRRPPVLIKVHACQAVRVAWKSHVYYPWQNISIRLAHLRSIGQLLRERQSIQKADLLCVPSRRIWDEMIIQGLQLPENIAHIPNPYIVDEAVEDHSESDFPLVLFVGRIEFGKGIEFLPSIVETVLQHFPKTRFEIVGSDTYARGIGSLKFWLENKLGTFSANVNFKGRMDAKELNQAYKRAWVVIVPSRWDNFPTVVLEAMAKARPIVASPHGGMPEMLEGTGSFIVDPAEGVFAAKVCHLLGDSIERRKIGKACLERVQQEYNPKAIVSKYIQFVKKVC